MYTTENIAGQYGMRHLRQQFPAEIGTKPQLTTEQHEQLDTLRQAYYQDLRNKLITECAEYAADELADAGYTAEQVREIIEDAHRSEYGKPDAYREVERITRAGIIYAVQDMHIPTMLMDAFGVHMEFSDAAIPGDIVLGDPAFEVTGREEIKAWNREVVFSGGVNLRWAMNLQVAHQIHLRYSEWILAAVTDRM